MSLQNLSAISEIIAALAVVISLIYVAKQIRQNNRQLEENTHAARASSIFSGLQLISDSRMAIFNNSEMADICYRGFENPEDLSDVETLRFRLLFSNVADALFNTFSQTKASGFSPETWAAQEIMAARIIGTAGGRWFWSNYGHEYREDFQIEIDRITQNKSS
ncbi:MAG: hypothetical protein JKX92_15770 [Porticoccaceae bacterium]|nr:hypothetical protein [Porticoccaceae bacterium]